jgi:serine/threonine-protein kinase RsbW
MTSASSKSECALEISKNGPCFTACFLSAQENVSKTTEAIATWLEEESIDPECSTDATLALAEALNNVVEHAYNWSEEGRIDMRLNLQDHLLTAQVTDQGQAFNGPPAKKPMENRDEVDLLDLPEGGFGWFMIHSLCTEINFVRKNNRNNLTLILPAADAANT